MKRMPIPDDAPYRYFLVEYDPKDPDPCFTPDLLRYIESRQPGLTARDIAKLDEIEWFAFHRHLKTLNQFAIPGLRAQKYEEVRYLRRYDAEPYWKMINEFFAYVPDDFPSDQVGRCNLPGYRLTCPEGGQFYPISYNGDLAAWRKRLTDNAEHFNTTIGRFDHGRFVVSDGREIEFADMDVESYTHHIPPGF